MRLQMLHLMILILVSNAIAYRLVLKPSSNITTRGDYSLYDANLFTCLDQVTTCTNGFSLSVNITLFALNRTNRLVDRLDLVTSGGDSNYANGFYLHQVNENQKEYLEFGVSSRSRKWSIQLLVSPSSDEINLFFTWDLINGISAYVDRVLVSNVNTDKIRDYMDLRFDPIRNVAILIDRLNQTLVSGVAFYDSVSEGNSTEFASSEVALRQGCIQSASIRELVDYAGRREPLATLCKSFCVLARNQVFLTQTTKCSCMSEISGAFSQMRNTCDVSSITWSVFVGTHIIFNATNKIGLSIQGPKSLIMIAGNPVVLRVSVSMKNTRTQINFGEGVIKFVNNDGYVFYEYKNPGVKIIQLKATNLENQDISESSELRIDVVAVDNGKPVEFIKLVLRSTLGLKLDASLIASGGLPYDCVVNYGNTQQNSFKASARISNFNVSYAYSLPGLYNLSATCTSGSVRDSLLSDWILVYVTNGQIMSRQLYLAKDKLPSSIDLELPVKYISSNLNFEIFNSKSNIQSWINTQTGAQLRNYLIPFDSKNLIYNQNLIFIKTNEIILGSFSITVQSSVPTSPKVTLVNAPKPSEPLLFRIQIAQKTTNSILRVDFGDESVSTFNLGPQTPDTYEFTIGHTYMSSNATVASFTLANFVSSKETFVNVVFERELGDFVLKSLNNATELNEEVAFSLSPINQTSTFIVDKIIFGDDQVLERNYIFSSENSFVYKFKVKFDKYGYQYPQVKLTNSVSIRTASTVVKIGSDLTNVYSYVNSNFVYLGDSIQVFVEVETGNGYSVKIDYGQETVTIPWETITSKSAQLLKTSFKYRNTGLYLIKVMVENFFGRVSVNVCGSVRVISQPAKQLECLKNDLTILSANERNDVIEVPKGLDTSLSVNLEDCPKEETFTFIWSLFRPIDGTQLSRPVDDYCFISNSTFLAKRKSLDQGTYSLSVTVFNEKYGVFTQISNRPLIVTSSPLIASIKGPQELELGDDENYTIDFYSGSYDPDQNEDLKLNLQFILICSVPTLNDSFLMLKDNLVAQRDFDLTKADYQLVLDNSFTKFFNRNCLKEQLVIFNDDSKEISMSMSALNFAESNYLLFELVVFDSNRMSVDEQRLKISSLSKPSTDLNEMAKQLSKLDDLASRDPKGALKFVSGFADTLNNIGTNEEHTLATTEATNSINRDDKMSGLRGKMLGTMDKIVDGVGDPDSIATAAGATSGVTANADQMPLNNQDSSSSVLEKMGEKSKGFREMTQDTMSNLGNNVLGAGGNIFEAAVQSVPKVENNITVDFNETEPEPVVELPKKLEAPLEFYHNCDDCEEFPEDRFQNILAEAAEKERIENEIRKRTALNAKRCTGGISGVASALTSSNGSTSLEKKGLALVATKVSNESSGSTLASSSGTKISMPKLKNVLNDSQQGLPEVSSKLLVADKNPYQSVGSKSTINSPIVTLQLADDNGNELLINNTKEPFVISIPSNGVIETIWGSVNLLTITYHKTFVPTDDSSLSILIVPQVMGDIYHVFISHSPNRTISEYPSEKSHDWVFTLPRNKSSDESTEDKSDFRHTIFLSNNETKGKGYYFIGIKLILLSNDTKTQTSIINSTIKSEYSMRLFTSSCKYWSEKHNEWRTEGCFVGRQSTYKSTECLCYHLTTFGSDMVVPPNTIDFSNVWSKFNLNDNAAVFSTIVSLFGLYIIIAIWAHWKDKKDLIKWGAAPLVDNLPTDEYYYLISVQTGVGREAGTQSNVAFVLSGEDADSGVRKLADGKRKGFSSGSQCNFICSVDEKLGPLTYLRVWHDNSGHGTQKSWFLNMVYVIDLQTHEKFSFVCEKWFAVERGDGQIDRILPAASKKELVQFSHLFTKSIKKKFTDGHLWFSIFSRPTKSRFTRLQRIACAMSLLFCSMIANAMFYRADDKAKANASAIHIGPITFTMSQLFTSVISTLIVVPVNIIIVTIFRKAKHKSDKIVPNKAFIAKQKYWRRISGEKKSILDRIKGCFSPKEEDTEYKRDIHEEAQKREGRVLPHWFIYIAWCLCFVATVVPAFFCILYSMEWGRDRSNAWLTSIALSFFQGNLVVDPLKVLVITAIITFVLRKVDDDEVDNLIDSADPIYNAIANHDADFLKQSMSSLSQIDLQKAIASRKTKLTKIKTLDPEELEKQRVERLKEIKMNEVLREMASYLFFLIVLLFLCHQSRDPNSYKMHRQMSEAFLENPIMPLEDIKSRPDFWTYVEEVFLPQMYASSWYNEQRINWREKLMVKNRYAIRVGTPRIRQLRVKNPSCKVHPTFKSIVPGCRNDYNWIDDDTKDYDQGWIPLNETLSKDLKTAKCKNSWCYQNTLQTKGVPITGLFTTYKGGGYVAVLGKTLNRSIKVLTDLKEQGWIDQQTRAVFFEFTVYNPNVNLFSSATFIIEYLSTGAAVTYVTMNVFRLYNYVGSFAIVVVFFQVLFICFLIYFIVNEGLQIKKQGRAYFKQFWNVNEMIMISFSIVSIAMYVMKNTFTTLAMKLIRESEANDFVNFGTIALWDDTFTSILAMAAFCATLKFMKLLRFNKRIGMLAETLKCASADLRSFCFTLLIVLFAYAQFGYAVFGNMLAGYKTFMSSVTSVFLILLGQFDLGELTSVDKLLGMFFFATFVFFVFIGMMTIFMTILNDAFAQVKEDMETRENDYEFFDFMFERIKKINVMTKFSLGRKNKKSNVNSSTENKNEKE